VASPISGVYIPGLRARAMNSLTIERRLTRLETLVYILLALQGLSLLGVRLLDPFPMFHW
jgi:hypothetical protein